MLKFDFSDFEKMSDRLDVAAKQLPFAISKAMNKSPREFSSGSAHKKPGGARGRQGRAKS